MPIEFEMMFYSYFHEFGQIFISFSKGFFGVFNSFCCMLKQREGRGDGRVLEKLNFERSKRGFIEKFHSNISENVEKILNLKNISITFMIFMNIREQKHYQLHTRESKLWLSLKTWKIKSTVL